VFSALPQPSHFSLLAHRSISFSSCSVHYLARYNALCTSYVIKRVHEFQTLAILLQMCFSCQSRYFHSHNSVKLPAVLHLGLANIYSVDSVCLHLKPFTRRKLREMISFSATCRFASHHVYFLHAIRVLVHIHQFISCARA
jgi:hypothetical protein